MNETRTSPRVVRFGAFEVDLRAGELRKHGIRIKLQEQPLQVLAMLLERPGDVVMREELRTKLWPADTFVDFDHGLNSAINKLREALGDSADNPRFIETLARRGYRFITSVELPAGQARTPVPSGEVGVAQPRGPGPSPDPASGPSTGASAPEAPIAPRAGAAMAAPKPRDRYLLQGVAAVAAAVAMIIGLNVGGVRQRLFGKRAAAKIQSIAVLPLDNLSRDPEQEYFADGMTDELIAELAQISALRVISRTSVMQYKGVKKPLPEIARELGVEALVEGTVLRSGDRVRVTANLVQAVPEKHLWAQEYERDLRDVLVLQSDVASAIAHEIQAQLPPQEQAHLAQPRSVSPEAYEAYLKGRYYSYTVTPESLSKAVSYFEQAIAKDPSYAQAYAGLADSYVDLAGRLLPPKEAMPKANAAALRALELDPNLGEGHAQLGSVKLFYDFDWAGAEREYKRALELDPRYPGIHVLLGNYLMAQGHAEQSAKEYSRARELAPLSVGLRCSEGRGLYYAHQYDRAIERYKAALEMDPKRVGHCIWLGLTYEQKGMMGEAIAEIQRVIGASPNETLPLGALARAYGLMGQSEEAHRLIRQLTELSKKRYVSPYDVAVAYTGLGDRSQAMAWLEKAYEERAGLLVYINVDPVFDGLRSDPRFQGLLRHVGLPP